MQDLVIPFTWHNQIHHLRMAFVEGTTADMPFLFGNQHPIQLPSFFIATTLITQACWSFVLGDNANRSEHRGDDLPVEQVSWLDIQGPGGFLDVIKEKFPGIGNFRLPTEAEWEYAARGGKHWQDNYLYSGGNDMNAVGWYEGNAGPYTDLAAIAKMGNGEKKTTTHPVAQKTPNQLGLYDMSGNLWEWCEDGYTPNADQMPTDGSAYAVATDEKVLRGGCHHNGAVHCRSVKRYAIRPDSFDGCIGFRLAMSNGQ